MTTLINKGNEGGNITFLQSYFDVKLIRYNLCHTPLLQMISDIKFENVFKCCRYSNIFSKIMAHLVKICQLTTMFFIKEKVWSAF